MKTLWCRVFIWINEVYRTRQSGRRRNPLFHLDAAVTVPIILVKSMSFNVEKGMSCIVPFHGLLRDYDNNDENSQRLRVLLYSYPKKCIRASKSHASFWNATRLGRFGAGGNIILMLYVL